MINRNFGFIRVYLQLSAAEFFFTEANMKKAIFTLTLFALFVLVQLCNAQIIPHTEWKLLYADSQEMGAENGAAVNAFDGKASTFWHTKWYPVSSPLPHEIQIDLGQVYNLNGFRYLARQDGSVNGRIGQYEFYVSIDGANWGVPVATGTFANDALEKEVLLPATAGRFIRLRALTEVNNNPWACAAEINVLGDLTSSIPALPRTGWSLRYVDSQELAGENGAAGNAFDGKTGTFWHTQWYPVASPPPHEIQIDLGQVYDLNGFRYLARQDGGVNGRIGQYEFYVSINGTSWGGAVAVGTFANDALEKEVLFAATAGRFIRLRALTEVNNNPWTCAAEINVLGGPVSGNNYPEGMIDSPAADITINAGDQLSFSGTGTGGNQPLSYLWRFGTGSGIPDSTLQNSGLVQFNAVGTYTVTFTVTDALGISDPTPSTRTITVSEPALPQIGWSLRYVDSQELAGEKGGAVNAFDGKAGTFWHTQWYPVASPPPHEIQIDLGQIYDLNGFRYLARQDGGVNGRIGQYEFYVSIDGANWGVPVATGAFANDALEKEVLFPATAGRFIRLRALTEVNNNPWACAAEINVLGGPASGNNPPDGTIKSPAADITINAGDQYSFAGTGTGGSEQLSYLWRFGTGSGIPDSTLQNPGLVQFNAIGTFTVTLNVTDAVGLPDSTPASRTVTVRQAPVPHTNWKLLYADSQELVGEKGGALNAFDDNPATFWHTKWYPVASPPPHEIQIDLGQMIDLNGFRYLARQDGGVNGRIGQYEFYVSIDGANWGVPVATGAFANDALEKEVLFPATTGQFIRLRALTEVNNNPWTCAAEINVLGEPASGAFPPKAVINSPFADMTINPGEWVNFAGAGSDPGNNLPLSYLWRFGAGSGIPDSPLQNPGLVQFSAIGTFPVSLMVTNTLGLSNPTLAARTIAVKPLPPLLPDMYSATAGPFNLVPVPGITIPVLGGEDVTDIAAPRGVADPFLFHDDDGTWHMFLEVMAADYSRIGHATSPDGLHWTYDRIVLDDGRWHSYPSVLKYNGNYYMVPESWLFNEVRIYQAASFPYNWNYVATLAQGRTFVDPQIFRYNGTWWMFVSDTNNRDCYLYYSDDLLTGWVEHPKSPVIRNDASKARGGGRAFVLNGRVFRTAQKDDLIYGEKVRVFAVDVLTRTDYAEHEVPESPVLVPSGTGWNADGMHHFDPWWAGDKWISAVDGLSNPTGLNGDAIGSIGIYISQ